MCRHPGVYALLMLQTADVIRLDIALIEKLDGRPVPPSSLTSPLGFTNADNDRSQSWQGAGYKVWSFDNGIVEFHKK